MKIKYTSNNSGGDWWLSDDDWLNLEKAGWAVEWFKDSKDSFQQGDKEGRWLTALATSASKDFETPGEAMVEFEKITIQKVSDKGCGCCGSPHMFSWGGEETDDKYVYASGEECLQYLYPDKELPETLREAIEQYVNKRKK